MNKNIPEIFREKIDNIMDEHVPGAFQDGLYRLTDEQVIMLMKRGFTVMILPNGSSRTITKDDLFFGKDEIEEFINKNK